MSRLPSRMIVLLPLTLAGCMNAPMYQPYPYGGQQMYAPQNGYTQPGTLIIPPSNTAPYQPRGTYEDDAIKQDDFNRESGSGTDDDKFFKNDGGGVPPAKDPASGSSTQPFDGDINP